MRKIEDILLFRSDISPFLVHLTRSNSNQEAKEILGNIINERKLVAGDSEVSDAKFAITEEKRQKIRSLFKAICFTETPLNEVHCLLKIKYRKINLEPYGLVFVKDNLRNKGVSPVLYFNNYAQGNKDNVFQTLCSLGLDKKYKDIAAKILPLVAVFGYHINNPSGNYKSEKQIDFLWEREWRYPGIEGDLEFTENDIFIGLCPDDEIEDFESKFESVEFIDPMRNIEWYASKLIAARKRLELKYSVV